MNGMPSISCLNGPLGTRLLRNRGRSRALVAQWITVCRMRGLQALLRDPGSLRLAARPVEAAVSLTSWTPRLHTLPLVLLGLLAQTVRPSAIHVWLTPADNSALPLSIRAAFEFHGVSFRECDDLGPHKKWLPLMETGETKPFVICDDDILYPRDWLERLLVEDRADAYVGVRCHRARRTTGGELLPYAQWDHDVAYTGSPDRDLFITGCGGAVIHPERLGKDYLDRSRIIAECPKADDIWLKSAHLAAGFPCHKTKFSFPCLELPNSQGSGLLTTNVDQGQNDKQMGVLRELLEIP